MLLTTPIWLFALAAIGIPVVIHLWNIRPGKMLKVGSISLFTESSPKSSRSFKLMDILLLILRCAILILLALILAAPFWQQHLKAGKAKGWVLIPDANFTEMYSKFQHRIDSLVKHGYEVHYFAAGFRKISTDSLLKGGDHADAPTDTAPVNYWALTKLLSKKIPSSTAVEIFTTGNIGGFTGSRPRTNLHINWRTYNSSDSVRTWPAAAWLTANGTIRVMQGTSNPSGTNYQYIDIKNGGQNGSIYSASVENGVPVITSKDQKISVDTATQHIVIYTDNNKGDANYLKAALNAIAQLTQRKTAIKLYTSPQKIPGGQDWLYWLSEQPIGQTIAQKTKNIFRYETGKSIAIDSWINNTDNFTQGAVKVSLYKTIDAKPVGDAVWTDGFGKPVLSQDGNTYHFYNRFNPTWSDLVWSDDFPKWLMALTQQPLKVSEKYERRAISPEQLQPVYSANTATAAVAATENISITNYLWLLLAITFIAERWLATKNKPILTNG